MTDQNAPASTLTVRSSAHSPAPWIASSHYAILSQDKICIAEVYGDEHIEADHRLIAAAPDLLNALRNAYIVMINAAELGIADTDEGCAIPAPYARLAEELRFVGAAIAKAGL